MTRLAADRVRLGGEGGRLVGVASRRCPDREACRLARPRRRVSRVVAVLTCERDDRQPAATESAATMLYRRRAGRPHCRVKIRSARPRRRRNAGSQAEGPAVLRATRVRPHGSNTAIARMTMSLRPESGPGRPSLPAEQVDCGPEVCGGHPARDRRLRPRPGPPAHRAKIACASRPGDRTVARGSSRPRRWPRWSRRAAQTSPVCFAIVGDAVAIPIDPGSRRANGARAHPEPERDPRRRPPSAGTRELDAPVVGAPVASPRPAPDVVLDRLRGPLGALPAVPTRRSPTCSRSASSRSPAERHGPDGLDGRALAPRGRRAA
jgi:hypothetical protein